MTESENTANTVTASRSQPLALTVTPARLGEQIFRCALPFAPGFLTAGQGLVASYGDRECTADVRVLTWHPAAENQRRSIRRAMVTFSWTFADQEPMTFALRPVAAPQVPQATWPVQVDVDGDAVHVVYGQGTSIRARLIAPARSSDRPGDETIVEDGSCFKWRVTQLDDSRFPRRIEVRVDRLGTVTLVGHVQRLDADDGYAPTLGWQVDITDVPGSAQRSGAVLEELDEARSVPAQGMSHSFEEGIPCRLVIGDGQLSIAHPAATFKRCGGVTVSRQEVDRLVYTYARCTAGDRVPMQEAAWRRAELVISPTGAAPLTSSLQYSHDWCVDGRLWDALYDTGERSEAVDREPFPALLAYHHEATLHSALVGDDWGNVTSFDDQRPNGVVLGMNRLNHGVPLFYEGYRTGDRRLVETAIQWCDDFYDQSVWWGKDSSGGTRYNNVLAIGGDALDGDDHYMWRSNRSVDFCTKGFDAFYLAYEETGDPRMMEALEAQVAYSRVHAHANDRTGKTRNVGIARDFARLYRYTGDEGYRREALRLFHELCEMLSTGDLFAESGRPLEDNLPFIDEDKVGYNHPFAKPYILGYALESLPYVAEIAPDEPRLRQVIRAVADYMAESQDPLGGWRYPHPRSSGMIMNQALEHAWQLTLADRVLGVDEAHLDAIERALRQRIWVWRKTGRIYNYHTGWERATGAVTTGEEMERLYAYPEQRDGARDYVEGQPLVGGSSPEGLVYLGDVLTFYLEHRSAERLLAPPEEGEPLGKVLNRL